MLDKYLIFFSLLIFLLSQFSPQLNLIAQDVSDYEIQFLEGEINGQLSKIDNLSSGIDSKMASLKNECQFAYNEAHQIFEEIKNFSSSTIRQIKEDINNIRNINKRSRDRILASDLTKFSLNNFNYLQYNRTIRSMDEIYRLLVDIGLLTHPVYEYIPPNNPDIAAPYQVEVKNPTDRQIAELKGSLKNFFSNKNYEKQGQISEIYTSTAEIIRDRLEIYKSYLVAPNVKQKEFKLMQLEFEKTVLEQRLNAFLESVNILIEYGMKSDPYFYRYFIARTEYDPQKQEDLEKMAIKCNVAVDDFITWLQDELDILLSGGKDVFIGWKKINFRICPPGILGKGPCQFVSIADIIKRITNWIFSIAPFVLVILIILGGLMYMLSPIKFDQIQTGHRYIQWAIWGYVFMLLISLIFSFIGAILGGPGT